MKNHRKLFIPGPSEVRTENMLAMATPQVGHRAPEFSDLYGDIQPKIQKLLYTTRPVFMVTSSATGVMEGSVRNLAHKKCISFVNGAFSDRWYKIVLDCGIPCDAHTVEMGKAIKPEMIDERLKTGEYDCMTFVYNETSTGVMNPIEECAEVWGKYPDVSVCVDAVSAMAGVKIEFDRLGMDVLLAGMQKCFALPSGLTVCAVSEKALAKNKKAKGQGYYFDFNVLLKSHEKNQTPTTPAIPHLFGLNNQLDYIVNVEGIDNRWARHLEMAKVVQDWAIDRGFGLFAEDRKYASTTLTCLDNRKKEISVKKLNDDLKKYWVMISNGYGDIKDKTFRIAHMGDATLVDIYGLLAVIDKVLGN
ncbi:MAG: alanine--glyoxylate aminotransferase family protein [bacterium]